jgi:hypothetical protein
MAAAGAPAASEACTSYAISTLLCTAAVIQIMCRDILFSLGWAEQQPTHLLIGACRAVSSRSCAAMLIGSIVHPRWADDKSAAFGAVCAATCVSEKARSSLGIYCMTTGSQH